MRTDKLDEIIDTLEHRGSEPNQVIVEVAINNAIEVMKSLKRSHEPSFDFQGWPEEKMTFGQLKKIVNDNGEVSDDTPVRVLVDDGMGYGSTNGICTGAYMVDDEFQIWL